MSGRCLEEKEEDERDETWNKPWNSWVGGNKSQAHAGAGMLLGMKSSERLCTPGIFPPLIEKLLSSRA